jgi:hypothetical protein
LIVYGPDLAEIARHELYPPGTTGKKHSLPEHCPGRDRHHKYELLKERFAELGDDAVRFLDGIIQTRRCGKDEAFRVLGLLATYQREDLVKALERASRYRAFSFSAVERILAAQARPRFGLGSAAGGGARTSERRPPGAFPLASSHGGVSRAAGQDGERNSGERD